MLINISLPANLLGALELLYEVANFDMIPLEWITDFISNFYSEQDKNKHVYLGDQAEKSGDFDSSNPIVNSILPIFVVSCTNIVLLIAVIP